VAIVNQTLARRLWPGQNALGRRFRWGRQREPIEVIGIAQDGKYRMIGEGRRAHVYVPLAQDYAMPVTLHLRTHIGTPLALAPQIRLILQNLDPDLPVFNIRTMDEHLRESAFALLPLRMGATLVGVQGTLALALAIMAIYSVVSYSVRQQTRDLGVRVALGARTGDLVQIVTSTALRSTLIGLVLGLLVSLSLARVLAALLYGLNPVDLPVFGLVAVLVLVASLFACWVPA